MRLRTVMSRISSAILGTGSIRSKVPNHRVHLRCDDLEAREVPAANLMGINLSGVEDWSTDRMFADAMKSARRPSNFGSHEGQPPIDANGWPATNASIVVWHGIGNMNGAYKLSFTGQADVSTYWGATTISNKSYNSATNTTTADMTYWPVDGSGLLLNFANTRRTSGSASNTGVTNIRLMRPVAPGSSTSYDPSATFTTPLKDLVNNFSVVRMMDNTGSNGGLDLNGNWAVRRPASYGSQAAIGAVKGMAWEYAIQFWNETDKDAWVNIPFPADDGYVTQLATLLKNNLEPGRKIYVEYSNELWNTYGGFPAGANHDAAVAEVKANPNSPLNFDGIYPSQDPDGWGLAKRRIALRTVQVSNLFRQVFGDDQMMTRVRPVMMSQLGAASSWLATELDFVEDFFNSSAQPTPHSPNYYLYGAGGSAYQDPDWSIGNNITVDQVFATMPKDFTRSLQEDLDLVAAFGLQRIAYEGGPSLDNMLNNQGVPTATLNAAWADPRMRTELVANHNAWSANGGDLLMYFASTGGCQWGMTFDTFTPDTQKMRAIADLNAAPAASVTYGKLAPLDLVKDDFKIPLWQNNITNMRADSSTQEWGGAIFRVDSAGTFNVRLTATASNGGKVEVFVDGKSAGTIDVPANGDTASIPLGTLQPGEHGIVLRARAGTFGLSKVSVIVGQTTNPPAAPTNLSATANAASIALAWTDRSTDETNFSIDRATDSGFTAGLSTVTVGANVTTYTDASAASGVTYYYRVRAGNGGGWSGYSNTASATISTANGLTATYFDNKDFTGTTVSRTDPKIDFLWTGSPASGIDGDTFSVRWEGRVQATTTGTYRFRTHSDDGVRLWLNGQMVVDNWTDHAGTNNTTAGIALTGGQRYDVKMEFYDSYGGAVARLSWLRPGQASFVIIPQAQLYPLQGGPILFADNFDSGLGNWQAVSGDWGNYGSYAGRTQLNASVGATSEELSIAATANWSNYSTAAWVNLANWNGGLGLMGRWTDTTHYYMLEIKKDSSGNPAWFISKRDGGDIVTLASGSLTYTANTWLRLRLTMNGSTLTAESSADGTNYLTHGSATDGTFTTGRIGLRAWGSAAFFDDVVVQGV